MKISNQASFSDKMKKGLTEKGITTRSIIAFVIFGMIVVVFILSGYLGRHSGGTGLGLAAEVNGEIISLKDFNDEENRMSQYYAQLFGGQFDMGAQRAMLRGEVMNTIVTKALSAQAAEKEGIYATDAEIRHMITEELPYFKRDGQFQSDAYKNILAQNRMSPGEFENQLRKDIKNQRSRQLFESSMIISDLQKSAEKELRSAQMNLDYIQLSGPEYALHNKPTSAQMAAKWADPEFKKKVEENFKTNEASYETKEQIKASHILIKSDAATDAEAQKKAQATLKRLEKEDFGKVAAQVSDDPGSKAKNGDLGYFTRGRMVKEFEEAAFNLPIGKVSGLVKSNFGYHIIKVTDKKAYAKADFEKVKNEIAQKICANESYAVFIKAIETDLAAGKVDAVTKTLADNNMKWKETGYFDMAAEVVPVINSTQALKIALDLTKDQPVAKRLVREGDAQFLLKLKDAKIETASVKPQDQELLERQKSSEAYRSWIEDFKKTARIETNSSLLQAQAQNE